MFQFNVRIDFFFVIMPTITLKANHVLLKVFCENNLIQSSIDITSKAESVKCGFFVK